MVSSKEIIKIICILSAHNEDRTIRRVAQSLISQDIPIISCLDSPTARVEKELKCSLKTYYMPKCSGEHIHREIQITDLVNKAATFSQILGYTWCLRIDSDEIWDGVRSEIEEADRGGYDIADFCVTHHRPTQEYVDKFIPEDLPPTLPGDLLYAPPRDNNFQRAWRLGGGRRSSVAGHKIEGDGRVYTSNYYFHHYPAIDFKFLRWKISKKYPKDEMDLGWHTQYKHISRGDI